MCEGAPFADPHRALGLPAVSEELLDPQTARAERKQAIEAEQVRAGRQPWEKRPSESMRAFTAFALYRDLGYHRTHKKVAEELGVGVDAIHGWSSEHDWRERVELYEVERDKRLLEAEMTEQKAARQAEGIAARAMIRKGLQRVNGDEDAGVIPIDPNEMDSGDVVKFISEGVRLQRMSLGMPTDLSKSALTMSFQEVGQLVRELVQGLLPLIPPERHQQAFTVVRGVTNRGNS